MLTTTKLAGVKSKPAKDNMQELKEGMVLAVVHEPDNKFDSNAMSVRNGEKHVGYIPAKGGLNKRFLATTTCTVTNVMRKDMTATEEDFKEGGFTNDTSVPVVAIQIEADLSVEVAPSLPTEKTAEEPTHLECEKVKSFNEGVTVNFYELPYHGFWYKGKRLHGVTRKINTMYEEFDSITISNRCAYHWDMSAEDIRDMWSRNGGITNQFGKIIHSGLENYETDNDHRINMDNKDVVEKIYNVIAMMKTNYDSYGTRGLAKMAVLKEIALDNTPLPEIIELCGDIVTTCPLSKADEVLTEVLVTDVENGVCGFIDRLTKVGDVYQVQDYKINVESEKSSKQQHENLLFPSLPYTKVSHYVCQESYYTELIGRTHKVSDTVVSYIWDGVWHLKDIGRIHGIIAAIDNTKTGA